MRPIHHEVRLVQLCFDFYMIEAKPENLIGDRAYDSDPLDEKLRKDGNDDAEAAALYGKSSSSCGPTATSLGARAAAGAFRMIVAAPLCSSPEVVRDRKLGRGGICGTVYREILQRRVNLFHPSHCRTNFLFCCHELT
jgi:hypothetical protein